MGRFSGPSPKRRIFMGNDESMIETLGQRAGYMSRADQARCPVRTAEIYTDHSGVQRHQGKKKELKSSQHHLESVCDIHPAHVFMHHPTNSCAL